MMKVSNSMGKVWMDEGIVKLELDGKTFAVPVSDLEIIGEFSVLRKNKWQTDHYISFKIRGRKQPIEFSALSEGIYDLLAELKEQLTDLSLPELQWAKENNSRILFPSKLNGSQLYEFKKMAKPLINLPLLNKLTEVEMTVWDIHPSLTTMLPD